MRNLEAIDVLRRQTGLDKVSWIDDGQIEFVIGGRVQMTFSGAPDETRLEAFAPIMQTFELRDSANVLLELNFAGVAPENGWFAIDQNAAAVVLRSQFDFENADAAKVVARFEGFAKAALYWMDRLPELLTKNGDTLRDLQEETLIRV